MKKHTLTFLVLLPLTVLLVLIGWTVFSALPGATMTGDLIAWLMELPVITAYALAAGGATMLTMCWTGMNIDNGQRAILIERAAAGDRHAFRVLAMESLQWVAILTIFSVVFFPHW